MLNLFFIFLKIGAFSFGASATEVIIEAFTEKNKQLTLEDIRSGIAIAGLSPGPFHVNLVLHLGFRLRGLTGMVVALTGFLLPSLILAVFIGIFLLNNEVYTFLKENSGIVYGVIAAISGILANAILKLSANREDGWSSPLIILVAIVLLIVYDVPFLAIIVGSGLTYLAIRMVTELKS